MQTEQLLRQQIDAINHKNMKELHDKFQELYGFECGVTAPRGLRKRIIYRLQELCLGGVDSIDMSILEDIADKDPLANLKVVAAKRSAKVSGTKLYRIWKGKQYEVTVGKEGKYIYNGEVFKSLSGVARKITGVKWNGKTFFGVKS
jgi:hypothetical protein